MKSNDDDDEQDRFGFDRSARFNSDYVHYNLVNTASTAVCTTISDQLAVAIRPNCGAQQYYQCSFIYIAKNAVSYETKTHFKIIINE